MEQNLICSKCIEYLKTKVEQEDFLSYVCLAKCNFDNNSKKLVVCVSSKYSLKFWKSTCVSNLQVFFQQLYPSVVIKIEVLLGVDSTVSRSSFAEEKINHINNIEEKNLEVKRKKPLEKTSDISGKSVSKSKTPWFGNIRLNARQTFESFIYGQQQNEFAYIASKRITEGDFELGNPLLLYGPSGLGKTHLLHAIVNEIKKKKSIPMDKIAFISSEMFVRQFVHCLRCKKMDDFKNFFRGVHLLLIDDVQFFAGKNDTQNEFFHTYNSLIDSDRQIVITSDKFPSEIIGLEKRLVSRIGSGLPISIEPPKFETRVAILMSKSLDMGYEINEECASLMARKIKSNVRELEGALKLVIANAKFLKKEITIELIEIALKELFNQNDRKISFYNIQQSVAEYYKIRSSDLISPQRTKSIALARQMGMSLCRELTDLSYADIGRFFGNRGHATAIYAVTRIKKRLEKDNELRIDYKNISNIILINH